MEWMKRNGALALGVGLPLLMVLFFALAAWLPKLLVAPPKYDVLFFNQYYSPGGDGLQYHVQNGRLTFSFTGENYGGMWPKLYRYSAATGNVTEIEIPVPADLPVMPYQAGVQINPVKKVTPVPAPEAAGLKLDTSRLAPDGYAFRMSSRCSDLFLFFFSCSQPGISLIKNGNIVEIPVRNGGYYYGNSHFIGWVIP